MSKILVVDDERAICRVFEKILLADGHTPLTAGNAAEALLLLEQQQPDALFLDIQLPGISGLELLEQIQDLPDPPPTVVMTAYGTMETAMQAMRSGAFDYLGKPLDLAQIRKLLQRMLHRSSAATLAPVAAAANAESGLMVGQSAPMQELFKLMGLLTDNDLTVLITGESGVGKELVARGIHRHSRHHEQPFITVNCAAIPETLLESELFGHEKGAFTGAIERQIGRCEEAGGGTLFLDEIAELPLKLQGKLLRLLQERNFQRIGSGRSIPLRARLLAATNRNLAEELEAGRFREDLYHRLNLVTLQVPPLRRRRGDIPLLASYFLQQANNDLNRTLQGIETAALERLQRHQWPGNVRELEHLVKRAALLAPGSQLTIHDLEIEPTPGLQGDDIADSALLALKRSTRAALRQLSSGDLQQPRNDCFHYLVQRVEQTLIDEALEMTDGNQVSASRLLGLNRTTLRSKLPDTKDT